MPPTEWKTAWDAVSTEGTYTSPTSGVGTINAQYPPADIAKHASGEDPWGYPDTDWFDDTFRDWAPQDRHNLQISGGSQDVKYMASLGYVFQDAIYNQSATFYKQYNARVNLDAQINPYIKATVGLMARREDRNYPTESAGAIFRMLMRGRPVEPAFWPNGLAGPDIENGQNPVVVTTNATGYVQDPADYLQANGSLEISNPWIEGLTLTLSGAYDINRRTTKTWQTPWELYYWDRQTFGADGNPDLVPSVRSNFRDPRLRQSSSSVLNTNLTALLRYDKNFGAHSLGLLAGVTKEEFSGDNFFAFRRNFISPALDQLFVGGADQQNTGGSAYYRPRLGYYGRAQYNYAEKYMVEFIGRYDGSYIFPESGRFGFFPGISAGWNVSNEDFFNVGFMDYLKVRGSYGQMGNDQVFFNDQLQEFAYLSAFGFGNYPINGAVVNTLREVVLANPNFTWERANNLNAGFDATLFNNRIDLTAEYFNNRRTQILIQESGSTPASSGISSLLPPVNLGEVVNRGVDFSLGYNGNPSKDLRFRAGVNGGYARNEVIFTDEPDAAPEYQWQEGKPLGAFLVYESNGVFVDQSDIESEALDYSGVTNQLLPGDMKFVDQDGNGIIDADDQIRLDQNTVPTFNFGANLSLQYKNFDLTVLLQGATGAMIRLQTESGDIGNYLKFQHDNRWSIDNPSSDHPRLASRGDTYYTGGNFGNNTYFLLDKDYIRLKNFEIGYRLPQGLLDKVKIGAMRVYVNGLNLLTIAANDIFDPEATAGNGVYYPQSRVINTGLSLTF
jgi:TonB-linked SusC/RagA family outer membrane protein